MIKRKTTYKCVESVEGVLKDGEAKLEEDVGDKQDNIELQPPHIHHKMLQEKTIRFNA